MGSAASTSPRVRAVVGVMTGTSIDGIDAALVRIRGEGLAMHAELQRHLARPLGSVGTRLRAAAGQQALTAEEFARLAWDFGQLHADVIVEFGGGFDLICIHGQTVFHQPPISWQLVNPAPIAQRFNCPVVSDLRQADLATGGQGAPITPIADWILFRDKDKRRAIINLGGFCNVTILPASPRDRAADSSELNDVRGFDVCACNQILDAVARQALDQDFDENGVQARRGRAKPQAAAGLVEILDRQRRGGRSLGTGDETFKWVDDQMNTAIAPADLAATAVDGIARCISAAMREHDVEEVVLAGGGARNVALRDALATHSQRTIIPSDALGVPLEARESMAFAVLGALCADGVPITLPQVTGCRPPARVSGTWSGVNT